jgi:type II secretory pathway component PulK
MKPRAGVVLMLVLWIIVVITTIGSSVYVATRSNTDITSNNRARVVARYAAESGVTVAVAALQDSLQHLTETSERRRYLNQLELALGNKNEVALGDASFGIALIDVGSRLDLNTADVTQLSRLFAFFTDAIAAESAARAIRPYLPLQSLDRLREIPDVPRGLADAAMEFLTVDGDGTINRATASDTVLAAAGGELRDEPSRILVVSRGWLEGHALTHEIQAVYGVVGNELTLIRWRERDL